VQLMAGDKQSAVRERWGNIDTRKRQEYAGFSSFRFQWYGGHAKLLGGGDGLTPVSSATAMVFSVHIIINLYRGTKSAVGPEARLAFLHGWRFRNDISRVRARGVGKIIL